MKSKKLLVFYFLLLLISVAGLILLYPKKNKTNVDANRDFPEIKSTAQLNIATDYNSVGYFISDDSVSGFQYEIIKALEQDWQIKVNLFLENSLDENLVGLSEGKYDIVARNIPVDVALRENFNFVESIVLNKQVLVQRTAAFNDGIEPLRQHLNLAKKTIHVAQNSPVILRLQNLSDEIGDTIFIEENKTYEAEQLVIMVAAGDIDFTVCDEKIAKQLAARLPEIDIETDITFTQLQSWAVRKNSPILLDSLNAWFEQFRNSKKFNRIYKKYY